MNVTLFTPSHVYQHVHVIIESMADDTPPRAGKEAMAPESRRESARATSGAPICSPLKSSASGPRMSRRPEAAAGSVVSGTRSGLVRAQSVSSSSMLQVSDSASPFPTLESASSSSPRNVASHVASSSSRRNSSSGIVSMGSRPSSLSRIKLAAPSTSSPALSSFRRSSQVPSRPDSSMTSTSSQRRSMPISKAPPSKGNAFENGGKTTPKLRTSPTSTPRIMTKKSVSSSKMDTRNSSGSIVVPATEKIPQIMKLPLDLLCRCFLKLESVFHIVSCASVCRTWRDALQLDVVWKELYSRWHEDDSRTSRPQQPLLPSGCNNYREAFINNFPEGRQRILKRTIAKALEARLLQSRGDSVTGGPQLFRFTPGIALQALAEELHMTFYISINHASQFRVPAKGAVLFPASCMLHCPFKFIKNGLRLTSLASVEIIVSSDRLSRSCTVGHFTIGKASRWEIISGANLPTTPLRLLQHNGSCGANLIVGTLLDSTQILDDHLIGQEQILFIKVGMHLSDVISKIMGFGYNFTHRTFPDAADPLYGLHGYHVSIQLHTFEKLIWTRDFNEVFWNERESVQGETAVLLLVSSCQVLSGKLSLPWRSEAFSGDLEMSLMADVTVWDARSEILWRSVKIFHLEPNPVLTVEYSLSEFEGAQFHASIADIDKGISASLKCSIPLNDSEDVFAVKDLRVSLSKRFLQSWFGVSNV